MLAFGVDIGGSGIKGAPVDLDKGALSRERFKVRTPHPATVAGVTDGVKQVVDHFGWSGPVGLTFPGVVTVRSTIRSASNVDRAWIDMDARALFSERLGGLPVTVVNDADAAGLAEVRSGAAMGHRGTVVLLTFGTGIGSALFNDGVLVPNIELGHLELWGHDAERLVSGRAKEEGELSWKEWAGRVKEYLAHVDRLFSPELIIIGGGISRESEKFLHLLDGVRTKVVPAQLHNDAGNVGAAMCVAGEAGV
ncbi:polyphosphate--glucose phosphotransferase [Streptomyces sp. NPDC003393]